MVRAILLSSPKLPLPLAESLLVTSPVHTLPYLLLTTSVKHSVPPHTTGEEAESKLKALSAAPQLEKCICLQDLFVLHTSSTREDEVKVSEQATHVGVCMYVYMCVHGAGGGRSVGRSWRAGQLVIEGGMAFPSLAGSPAEPTLG